MIPRRRPHHVLNTLERQGLRRRRRLDAEHVVQPRGCWTPRGRGRRWLRSDTCGLAGCVLRRSICTLIRLSFRYLRFRIPAFVRVRSVRLSRAQVRTHCLIHCIANIPRFPERSTLCIIRPCSYEIEHSTKRPGFESGEGQE